MGNLTAEGFMSKFKRFLESNKAFFTKSKDDGSGTLLFDVFFGEPFLIYGVSKIALMAAKVKGLDPLGLVSIRVSEENKKVIESMNYNTAGDKYALLMSFLVNFIKIMKLSLKANSGDSLVRLQCDSINVGIHIYDSILRTSGIPTLDKMSLNQRFRVVLELTYFCYFKKLIIDRNVKLIISSDNVYRYGLLFELSRFYKITCISPINLNTFSLAKHDCEEDFESHNRKAQRDILDSIDLIQAKHELESYFSERSAANIEQHDVLKAYAKDKRVLSRDELIQEYNLDPELPIVVIAAHIFCDAPHAYPGLIYKDYHDWFVSSVANLANNKKVNFLVKEHPSASLYNEDGIVRSILESFNVKEKLLSPDINSVTVLDAVDTIITCGGTIGLEFAYTKKNVVLAAQPPYSGYGFTQDFYNKNSYENFLVSGIETLKGVETKYYDDVLRVLYHDFVALDHFDDSLELGGQRYYLGREFDYDRFYDSVVKENETPFREQLVYRKIEGLLNNKNKHMIKERFN